MDSFSDQLLPLLQVISAEQLTAEIAKITTAMGFTTFSGSLIRDLPSGGISAETVHNMPEAYLDAFFDAEGAAVDPTMQHAKVSHIPIFWNQDLYVQAGQGEKWEHQAAHGLPNGIVLASHHGSRHFCLGLDCRDPIPTDPGFQSQLYANILLFNAYAQEAALRILTPAMAVVTDPKLTPRELEALKWTADGKTAWEVGAILGIMEGTVNKQLSSAQMKLDCSNKTQTVARAIRMGLV